MDRALQKLIGEMCDSKQIVKAMAEKDYDGIYEVLMELYEEHSILLTDEFSLFNMVYEAIKTENINDMVEIIKMCITLYKFNLIGYIVEYFEKMEEDNTLKHNNSFQDKYLFNRLNLIRLNDITEEDVLNAAENIILLSDENYSKAKAIHIVLNMPIMDEDYNYLLRYSESLIHQNQLTYFSLVLGVIYNKLDVFMEEFHVMKALREEFNRISSAHEQDLISELNDLKRIKL